MTSPEETARFRLLYDLGCAFAARIELDELIPLVVAKCCEVFDAESAAVLLLDTERKELYFPYVAGTAHDVASQLGSVRFPADQGIVGEVLRTGRALRVDDAQTDPRFYPDIDRSTKLTTRALLSAPLTSHQGTIGAVQIVNRRGGGSFDGDDLSFLEALAGSVAVAVGDAGDPLIQRLVQATADLKIGPTDRDDSIAMGPLIDASARARVLHYLDLGIREGAVLAVDGRKWTTPPGEGFFVGPSVFDRVTPEMQIARDEIFGPVLSVMRAASLEEAIAFANRSSYGNGAVIFTGDGAATRKFAREIQCGMVGVNVGVPAPMAIFPFSGWNQSFFGDLHMQGLEGIQFYTRAKVVLTRWNPGGKRTTWS